MKYTLPLICVLLFFTTCRSTLKKSRAKDEITKIEIAKAGSLRNSPATVISIDSSLTYNYWGGYNAKLQGYYTGTVTEAYWEALNTQLKNVDFNQLYSADYLPLDGEAAEVICYWGAVKKHVFVEIFEGATDYKSKDFREIAYSYERVQLHKMKDTAKFAVSIQHIRPPAPPRPKLDQVKFPPPTKNNTRQ
jgi:hypothetical protein